MRVFKRFFPAILCFLLGISVVVWASSVDAHSLSYKHSYSNYFTIFDNETDSENFTILPEPLPVEPIEYPSPLFPAFFNIEEVNRITALQDAQPYGVFEKQVYDLQAQKNKTSSFLDKDILAFYGKPNSVRMGILGRHSLEELSPILMEYVAQYDEANGKDRGVLPCLYLIYGTVWPEGKIGILNTAIMEEYIQYAAERGWIVVLDHQIGRYSVEDAMTKLLPLLKYPNVHLALDPEWRTTKPMKETGSVSGEEINIAQKMMSDYMEENNIPAPRMLVIHQFKNMMIKNRNQIRSDFPGVELIHCADGFGSPALKKVTYKQNANAQNIPLKSFKLFLKSDFPEAGYDFPLMSPEEVLALNPRPVFVMYQ